jgi:hypothetical protein
MTVRVNYRSGQKSFEILEESGSGTVRKKVFKRMLDSELKASGAELRDSTRVSSQNYTFQLLGPQTVDGQDYLVLDAEPRTKNKFLFRGRVFVDPNDFAVARIEATPAQKPSFWIRRTAFVHRYGKFGAFWLAVSNQSETDALVFGHTEVRIDYLDYEINPQDRAYPAQ